MNIREIFKNDVSKSAFKVVDGVTRVIGKYGEIEIIGNMFDIYFVGKDRTPLSTRRLNSVRKSLEEKTLFHTLKGEGYFQTQDEELTRFCLPLLGVRKKMQFSEEALKKKREHMARLRK